MKHVADAIDPPTHEAREPGHIDDRNDRACNSTAPSAREATTTPREALASIGRATRTGREGFSESREVKRARNAA